MLKDLSTNPRQILYINCEEITPQNPQKSAEILDGYISWARADFKNKYLPFPLFRRGKLRKLSGRYGENHKGVPLV